MTQPKITINYVCIGVLAVFSTWFIHELAHWLTSETLGYPALMRINGVAPLPGLEPSPWEAVCISAAGPLVTLLQGILAFLLLRPKWHPYIYLWLFTAFYMRLLAGVMNVINPNDEGRISAFLGWGTFTLPILVSALLFFLVYRTSKTYRLTARFQLWTTLIIMVASSILILSDQFFALRIL